MNAAPFLVLAVVLVTIAGCGSGPNMGWRTGCYSDRNVTGPFLLTRQVLAGMLERGWGRVINVASMAGLMGAPYVSAYTASKHALVGLTRALAAEVGAKGVTVNAICPAYVATDMVWNG